MKISKADRLEAQETLKKLIVEGGYRIYTTLKHVSRSGMSRSIDCHVIIDNQPRWISGYIARACDMSYDEKRECIKIGGCGMDMGFAIVYNVSSQLFKDYKCMGENCPASDHVNNHTDKNGVTIHNDGYAVSQKWM
jgi:hypothetical protein